jgi:hypothetical protein
MTLKPALVIMSMIFPACPAATASGLIIVKVLLLILVLPLRAGIVEKAAQN